MSSTFVYCVQERETDSNPTHQSNFDKHMVKQKSKVVSNSDFTFLCIQFVFFVLTRSFAAQAPVNGASQGLALLQQLQGGKGQESPSQGKKGEKGDKHKNMK